LSDTAVILVGLLVGLGTLELFKKKVCRNLE
jgi:hypothetical protein